MGIIKDIECSLGTLYEKRSNEGDLLQRVGAIGFKKVYQGQLYFIIMNWNGTSVDEANQYLNNILATEGYSKREQAFTALKLFYSFINLFNIINYKNGLTDEQVSKLLVFLKGGKRKGILWNIEFSTSRRNSTVSPYLSAIRDFYRLIFKVTDSPLHSKTITSSVSSGGMMGHANKRNLERYNSSPKIKKDEKAPKFIRFHEYDAILKLIDEKYGLREKVIIKLMYEYGLRLGEVLGITFEDIEPGMLTLRNRYTDKPYQGAKGAMTVSTRETYTDSDYDMEGSGYQVVPINEDMFEMITEYINETRDEFFLCRYPRKRKNLEIKCIADKVTQRDDIYENQYVFINKNLYSPITSKGWGDILKQIYDLIGIKVDRGVKRDNLSHRFRHGFAMHKAHVEGLSYLQLAKALRHSGISTVLRYYNPDEEQLAYLLKFQRENMGKRGE